MGGTLQAEFHAINKGDRSSSAISAYIKDYSKAAGQCNDANLASDSITVGDAKQATTQALLGAGVSEADITKAHDAVFGSDTDNGATLHDKEAYPDHKLVKLDASGHIIPPNPTQG